MPRGHCPSGSPALSGKQREDSFSSNKSDCVKEYIVVWNNHIFQENVHIKTQDYTPSLKWSTNLKKMTNDKEKRIKRQDGDYDKVYITRREGGADGGRVERNFNN